MMPIELGIFIIIFCNIIAFGYLKKKIFRLVRKTKDKLIKAISNEII